MTAAERYHLFIFVYANKGTAIHKYTSDMSETGIPKGIIQFLLDPKSSIKYKNGISSTLTIEREIMYLCFLK